MTRQGLGLAKTEVIRIHPEDLTDLLYIRKDLKLPAKSNKPGDVIHALIENHKKISPFFVEGLKGQMPECGQTQTTLDEYKNLYEQSQESCKTWRKATQILCEKYNEPISLIADMATGRVSQ